jgi:HK97 family phage prohead protease
MGKEVRQAPIFTLPIKVDTTAQELKLDELPALENIPSGEINQNTLLVEGYAIRYDEPTLMTVIDGIEYYETIQQGALDGADLSDVPFKYNHSDQVMIMARTRNKTLELFPDNEGLYVRANLANTTGGNDLYTLISRGDIDKMSFAFTVKSERYDRQSRTRVIEKIDKLFDVSAVDLPAYPTTSISARAFYEMEIEKEVKDLEKSKLRKELLLKTYF